MSTLGDLRLISVGRQYIEYDATTQTTYLYTENNVKLDHMRGTTDRFCITYKVPTVHTQRVVA